MNLFTQMHEPLSLLIANCEQSNVKKYIINGWTLLIMMDEMRWFNASQNEKYMPRKKRMKTSYYRPENNIHHLLCSNFIEKIEQKLIFYK